MTTNTIQRLDQDTINKIAAGEVVDRPASIVKELAENALDAGASRIEVNLAEGGKARIQVTDNGSGIPADEIPLAVERHATSKIRDAGDLFSIASMGFRGEALASIASVSRFTISSKTAGEGPGRSYGNSASEAGQPNPAEWHWRPFHGGQGTTVLVEQLFHSIPARRLFLKSDAAELTACQEVLTALAIAHPRVSFQLTHNGKSILDLAAASPVQTEAAAWQQRLKALFGDEIGDSLLAVAGEQATARLSGFISPPTLDRATAKWIFCFVNGRLIRDKKLSFAIQRGYHSHLMRGRNPVAILFIETDPTLIDVNVHPAKTEIRFQYLSDVQNLIAATIRQSLREGAWGTPPAPAATERLGPEENVDGHGPAAEPSRSVTRAAVSRQPEGPRPLFQVPATAERVVAAKDGHGWRAPAATNPTTLRTGDAGPAARDQARAPDGVSPDLNGLTDAQHAIPWQELAYIGCFAQCYLLFEHGERLLVVDQHAFHERILYEKLLGDASLQKQAAPLVFPDVLPMTPREIEVLQHLQERLGGLGFDYSVLDFRSIEVRAVPKMAADRAPEELLGSLIEKFEHDAGSADPEAWLGDALATIACHSAVRSGESLTGADLNLLIAEAGSVDFCLNCPHGRPVFKWFTRAQVGGWFSR